MMMNKFMFSNLFRKKYFYKYELIGSVKQILNCHPPPLLLIMCVFDTWLELGNSVVHKPIVTCYA